MLIKRIKKSKHYIQEHEKQFPWSEVVRIILTETKRRRRKGNKIEIETERYYVLCELKGNILWVINAKRK